MGSTASWAHDYYDEYLDLCHKYGEEAIGFYSMWSDHMRKLTARDGATSPHEFRRDHSNFTDCAVCWLDERDHNSRQDELRLLKDLKERYPWS